MHIFDIIILYFIGFIIAAAILKLEQRNSVLSVPAPNLAIFFMAILSWLTVVILAVEYGIPFVRSFFKRK